MINNSSLGKWDRLKCKELDSQFQNDIIRGLNCSPFEARAILDVVHNVYGDYFEASRTLKTGQTKIILTGIDNGPSKSLKDAEKVNVTITLDAGEEDLNIRRKEGVQGLRQHKLQRISNEALMQGGVFTIEDLAYRVFNCGERTLVRDIKHLKEKNVILPLRSTVKDMGRSISHRVLIVKQWLKGKEYSQIGRNTNHSVNSVSNYVRKFKQVVTLATENFEVHTIAFLAQISIPLAEEYINLWHHSDIIPARKHELLEAKKK